MERNPNSLEERLKEYRKKVKDLKEQIKTGTSTVDQLEEAQSELRELIRLCYLSRMKS